jgi:transcriptional regulator with XRE-family HTH domain
VFSLMVIIYHSEQYPQERGSEVKKGQRRYTNWKSTGFPGWLQAKMAERGWNALRLAHEIDVVPSLVSRWMSATQIPSVESLKAIAQAFQISEIEAMTAAGYLSPDEVSDDPRRLELLRQLHEVELTQERYEMLSATLRVMSQAPTPQSPPEAPQSPQSPQGHTDGHAVEALPTLILVSG